MTYLRQAYFLDTVELRLLPEGGPIRQLAKDVLDGSVAFQETVSSVSNKWQALGSVYEAPEQDLVLRAMDEPVEQAADHVEGARVFHAALDAFGYELDEVHRAVAQLHRDADAASLAWFDTLDELNAKGASSYEKESAYADGKAPLDARLSDIRARYERARVDCVRSLSRITRASRDVVSSYSSGVVDLASGAREEAYAAFDKAAAPGASPEDIAAFYNLLLLAGPDLLKELGRRPGAAQFVNGMGAHEEVAFWNKLNTMQQDALLLALPGLVGNLEGPSYATRDKANRQLLGILKEEYDKAAMNAGAGVDYDLGLRNTALHRLLEALERDGTYLIALDPRPSEPLAQVAFGDLDHAANVTYLVPGMNSSSADALDMAEQANNLRYHQLYDGAYGTDTAVIAYMGYESPNLRTVSSEFDAEYAAPAFATSMDGLYLTRSAGGDIPEVNIVAHSYGTTMSSIALGLTDYPVTSVVFLASAGLPEGISPADLNVDKGSDGTENLFISTATSDWLATTGSDLGGRRNPSTVQSPVRRLFIGVEPSWGGHQFRADEFEIYGRDYAAVEGHPLAGYLDSSSFSMKITGMVTGGKREEALALIRAIYWEGELV